MKPYTIKPNDPKIILIALVLIAGLIFAVSAGKTENKTPVNSTPIPIVKMAKTDKTGKYPVAAELAGISGYINTNEGFKLSDVAGKVILVDFWTYTCINCQRTQPYLNAWQQKYADKGLVIVGVHTPEFDFEKEIANVQKAVTKEGITYPVVLDNDYTTWHAYQNRYWPRKYLIDADGFIRYDHIGEGGYEETEQMIQDLLKERDDKIKLEGIAATQIDKQNSTQNLSQIGTPEIYLGYTFARAPLGNKEGFVPDQTRQYDLPDFNALAANAVYLEGQWKNNADNLQLVSDTGKILLIYKAKALNIVAGSAGTLQLKLNESPLLVGDKGEDVLFTNGNASVVIADKTLYHLVNASTYDPRIIEIDVTGKGFQLYTFTFG